MRWPWLTHGAASEWNEALDWREQCLDWRDIPRELAYYKPDRLAYSHRMDRMVPQLRPNRNFNTGCMMLDAFLTYYKHTPLLRSLLESLYWTYTIEFAEAQERRWSEPRSSWLGAVWRGATLRELGLNKK